MRAGAWCGVGSPDCVQLQVRRNERRHLGEGQQRLRADQRQLLLQALDLGTAAGGVEGWGRGARTSTLSRAVGSYQSLRAARNPAPGLPSF